MHTQVTKSHKYLPKRSQIQTKTQLQLQFIGWLLGKPCECCCCCAAMSHEQLNYYFVRRTEEQLNVCSLRLADASEKHCNSIAPKSCLNCIQQQQQQQNCYQRKVKMDVQPVRQRCQQLIHHSSVLFYACGIILCYLNTFLMPVHGGTEFLKDFRGTGLYARNNFTDYNGAAAVDVSSEKGGSALNAIGFQSEASIVLPESRSGTGCPPTTSSHCLRCNAAGCIKCSMYLVTDTRQCVEKCPAGYIDQWSAHTEFMGRVCVSTGYSGPLVAAFAGLLGGFLVCLTLLGVAVMLVRRKRRRKAIKQKLINENTIDRSDFLRQLNDMRPNAEYFLAMLNDTRRQIRKLYLSGDVAAANSYRPIVRDLAKLLILLNRPIELIPAAPHDWNRLYTWAEQALDRYKPQVGQLIDFFQTTHNINYAEDFENTNENAANKQKSIFRQSAVYTSTNSNGVGKQQATSAQKMHLFGSLISLHEFDEPRPSDPFGNNYTNTLKAGNLITDLNASSLWLEDEFYKLGFRPQDEITTEL